MLPGELREQFMAGYSEDALIEQPTIALFAELGWATVNCFNETFGPSGTLGRQTKQEVVLTTRLRYALCRLNPDLPAEAIDQAVEELARDHSALSPAHANQDVYHHLKQGVDVTIRGSKGETIAENVTVIDWNEPKNNDFLLASQYWVTGDIYSRRADLVGFVNGLPLVLLELKASHKRLQLAYEKNLKDYKTTIPRLFWYNALIILSNGGQSRIGTATAAWEHFHEWKRINDEGEQGVVSLETVVRGTCDKHRLLDIVENFTLFSSAFGGLVKILAMNHQYLGVNNAVESLGAIAENRGRLGVFWHTQGSGTSYSMIFFSQKVLRKLPGNHTFLIVTDRKELDDQIYKNFAAAGAVTEEEVHAESGDHLKQLLREDHRNIFTLIQKFGAPLGEPFPEVSKRSDIIVITDEAHRSQYATLALNMRRALPNAAFIAFTGTPLIAGEEKTKEVFGDYVSIYNFRQSVEDGATVPLYYENRIPELQLTNQDLNRDLEDLIDQADLDEAQQRKLEREFGREYHLITRDERLEAIAADLVRHYLGRYEAGEEHVGKAMVVSIDKATAVRMFDKVHSNWNRALADLKAERDNQAPGPKRERLQRKITFIEETDMAVVVSPEQNEIEHFAEKGLDIAPHRRRMVTEDLDEKFKNPTDPFRIVFVCAMWLTGFDVPSLSTIYLDKPMRNHTLMQTIARANRVFAGKLNGLIVDYVGVFRDIQRALAIYGTAVGGGAAGGEMPVQDKAKLVATLREAILETDTFCRERDINPDEVIAATGFEKVRLLDDAVESILTNDESKKLFQALTNTVNLLYRAILPDPLAGEFEPRVVLFSIIAEEIRSLTPPANIDEIMAEVEDLLDASIAPRGYVIQEARAGYDAAPIIDLNQIDFEALRKRFEQGRKHTEIEKLRAAISRKLARMVEQNKTRMDYLERFQQLIDEYNAGSKNVQLIFDELLAFTQQLNEEEQRAVRLGLSEEELAVFDLLTKPDPGLTEREESDVRKVAHDLLDTLKREKLVLDWRKRQQTRADVLLTIEHVLDDGLPRAYTPEDYRQRCAVVYEHVYDSYSGSGGSYSAGF
jgi:type I restriction enzyme, R subunit